MSVIKIVVVDDHPLFRFAIKEIFNQPNTNMVIQGEAGSGEQLFQLLACSTPDIILLDINLPDISGIEITKRLINKYPSLKILAISAENDAETVKAMLDAGAHGFISKKNTEKEELVNAIQSVMNGIEYFGSDISQIIYTIFVNKKKTTTVGNEFTGREKEIIVACGKGLLVKEISAQMGISINTVNTHKKSIFLKLGINNTMELVQYAMKNGIIRV